MVKEFGSKDVQLYTGIRQTSMRDWRRRGLLDSIGEEINGRWKYDKLELVRLAVANLLATHVLFDLERAFEVSGTISRAVGTRIQAGPAPVPHIDPNNKAAPYFFTWPRAEGYHLGIFEHDIAKVMPRAQSVLVTCIDMETLVKQLPHVLYELVEVGGWQYADDDTEAKA